MTCAPLLDFGFSVGNHRCALAAVTKQLRHMLVHGTTPLVDLLLLQSSLDAGVGSRKLHRGEKRSVERFYSSAPDLACGNRVTAGS